VCLVAERDPITTAKAVGSLDHLSGGRFRFGVGFGWNREEMEDHGVAFGQRREVTRESVLLMRSLWGEEVGAFDGEHVSVSPSSVWPKPAGRVPVWLGGRLGPKFLAALVDYCDGWIPMGGSGLSVAIPQVHAALEEAGRDPATFDIIPFGSVPTPGKLEYFASLGVTEVVCNVADPSRDAALRFLEDARVTVDTADVDA
jgi:alkanesulfonate monooxygenase SsuD/methylene tetrahydromethanopterin reductase-like flavin-dependent oxidoreductase (luciferase family)